MNLDHLSGRQKQILEIIINDFVETASPVGSKTVSDEISFDVSAATIRNEMAYLEEIGLITHPHTSAGRVPTDKGYRYFVDSLNTKNRSVDTSQTGLIAWEYRQKVKSIEELIERTSKLLSFLTEQAGIILSPSQKELVLKRVELIPYSQTHFLVVWVSTTGVVQNKMVEMDEEIPVEELLRLTRFINSELHGRNFSEVTDFLQMKLAAVKDSLFKEYKAAFEIASRIFQASAERRLYLDGSRFVLKQPEFQEDTRKARTFFQILETKQTLREACERDFEPGEVRVQIGSENESEDIWDFTLITTQYRCQNQPLGTLGVLGPKRMPYGRIIPLVDFIARRLSDALDSLV